MTLKEFLVDLPKVKVIVLFFAMIAAGFDGVVLAQVVSSVTKFNESSSIKEIVSLVIYGIITYFLVQLAHMIVNFLTNNIINYLNLKYKMAVMRAVCSPEDQKKDTGDIVSLLTVDLKLIQEKFFSVILESVYYFFVGLISLLYLIYLSPVISLLFVVCSFLPMIPAFIFGKMLGNATEKYTDKNNRLIKNVKDFAQGYSEIATYNAFDVFFNRTDTAIKKLEDSQELLGNKHAIVGFISAMLSWLGYLIPISIALLFVILGKIDAAVVIALFLASDRVIMPFRNLSESLRFIKSTEVTRENIRRLISADADMVREQDHIDVCWKNPELIFDNVTFGFEECLFSDVSFTIPYGSKVLITGVSGSGKSTLLDLIQKRCEPVKGSIYLSDSGHLSNLDSNIMSRVQQEPYYFELSLRDNLLMELGSKEEHELTKVLSSLGLLQELGEGCLDHIYGEQGEQLSGGQKQRIEVARALIHNKKIILVDEGTSSVDKESAKRIRELILGLDMTVLEVAHYYSDNLKQIYSHRLDIVDGKIDFYEI
ncbi:ABC transporter ATP-binding protein [Streptococcus mutans]|uniref:ABC transporter ATP-binding protein n=1 Tax=Streptococcus mutans TaxID=1309 RepID=UPI002988DF15|nr:ABC transporter ATP-binding protein [Streptococcus mutans]MDW5565744.1 ABC transporter ATP-binding protein [Streptococcus mutans]